MIYIEKYQGANMNASMTNYQNQGVTSVHNSVFDLMKYNLIDMQAKRVHIENRKIELIRIKPNEIIVQK
ncbi:MAG: hypothetical protein ABII85_01385 [Bacillota bacterium]